MRVQVGGEGATIVITLPMLYAPAYVGPGADEVSGPMHELVEWLNVGDLDSLREVPRLMATMWLRAPPWAGGGSTDPAW